MLVYLQLFVAQILLALCCYHGVLAEKMMRPKFKEIKLWSDEKILSHKITYDASDPHLNFTLDVHQDIANVDLHLEMRINNKLDPFYMTTINSTINFCRVLDYATKSPVGRIAHNFVRELGNIVESCPIAKGVYKIKHLHLHRKMQGAYFVNKFWWPEDPTTAMLPEIEFDLVFQAHSLDANKQRAMIANDHITGDLVVEDVNNLKPGIFALLPRVG